MRIFVKRRFIEATALVCGMGCVLPVATTVANGADIKCQRDDMRGADVRRCAELSATPGTSAHELSQVYAARAAAWMKDEEPLAAIADYTRAIEADPDNLAALEGRAHAHSAAGRHDLAAQDWGLVIASQPSESESYSQRGHSWLAAGQPNQALADFTRAVELEPEKPGAYLGRASAYEHLQDRQKAIQDLDRAVAAEPGLWTTYLTRAQIADRWGDRQMAIDNYRLVIKHNHQYWQAYKALHRLGASHHFGQK